MRSVADRDDEAQLAIPARPQNRRLRADPQPLHRMTPDARSRGEGAAPKGSGALTMDLALGRTMPAEWEKHEATWISWPHHEPDWPGKLAPIPWVYAEIVRVLHRHERVEILCHDDAVQTEARRHLLAHGVAENHRLHIVDRKSVV